MSGSSFTRITHSFNHPASVLRCAHLLSSFAGHIVWTHFLGLSVGLICWAHLLRSFAGLICCFVHSFTLMFIGRDNNFTNQKRRTVATMTMKSTRRALGHLLLHSLVCLHRSLICLLQTARFALALHCAHSFARSLTYSLQSSWENCFCL